MQLQTVLHFSFTYDMNIIFKIKIIYSLRLSRHQWKILVVHMLQCVKIVIEFKNSVP